MWKLKEFLLLMATFSSDLRNSVISFVLIVTGTSVRKLEHATLSTVVKKLSYDFSRKVMSLKMLVSKAVLNKTNPKKRLPLVLVCIPQSMKPTLTRVSLVIQDDSRLVAELLFTD